MWSPPDAPSSPERSPTVHKATNETTVNARAPGWSTPVEVPVWAPMQPAPHNGPANASLFCGILSVLMLGALVTLAILFKKYPSQDERYLLAGIVVAEESIVPSTLAIYFGRVAYSERFEPMLTNWGRIRSRLGILLGCVTFTIVFVSGIALIVVSRH